VKTVYRKKALLSLYTKQHIYIWYEKYSFRTTYLWQNYE